MKEEDNIPGTVNGTVMERKQGGVEDSRGCMDTLVYEAGSNQAAGRGDRNGTGNRVGTGIRVLKVTIKQVKFEGLSKYFNRTVLGSNRAEVRVKLYSRVIQFEHH